MKKLIILTIVILTACTTPISQEDIAATPAIENPTATATRTPISPTSTPTQIPSPTPTQALSEEGPYLVFQISKDPVKFVMMDQDGIGRKEIVLPEDAEIHPHHFEETISPNGKWMVFYSNTESGGIESDFLNPDIQIHMMSLETGQIVDIASLVSDTFPDNLNVIADALEKQGYLIGQVPDERVPYVGGDFSNSLSFTFSWSPDSKYLAFAAQLDGPSTDVYIYDLQEQTIERIEDSLQNVIYISWSPNGKRLAFANSIPLLSYPYDEVYSVDMETREIYGPLGIGAFGWLGSNAFTLIRYFDGGDFPFAFSTVDPVTGETIFDHTASLSIISREVYANPNLISDIEISEEVWNEISYNADVRFVEYLDVILEQGRFIEDEEYLYVGFAYFSENMGVYLVTHDFEILVLDNDVGEFSDIIFSPDNRWFIVISQNDSYNYVYAGNELLFTFEGGVSEWHMDSTGFYSTFGHGHTLYFVSYPSGDQVTIYQCPYEECRINQLFQLHP